MPWIPGCDECLRLRREFATIADELINASNELRHAVKDGGDNLVAEKLCALERWMEARRDCQRRIEQHRASVHNFGEPPAGRSE